MKMKTLLQLGCLIAATLSMTASALTLNEQVTPSYFSISVKDIAESKFDLSESGLDSSVNGVETDIPVVGSNVYQFRLLDFMPEDVLKSGPGK